VVWFDPAALGLAAQNNEGVENEQVLNGTPDQAVEGLRAYREWSERRTARIVSGSVPSYRLHAAETMPSVAEAAHIAVETITLPIAVGRPTGRKFGRVVHSILQHAETIAEVEGLAAIWGRAHGATDIEWAAAMEVARVALARVEKLAPAGAKRHRELPVMLRLGDGAVVEGRIDLAFTDGVSWTVIDYKTDRRDSRSTAQVQVYALALERATGLPARGIMLEV
jgi:ATP-dependent exoDNAse (exonuclease V) beta subunit